MKKKDSHQQHAQNIQGTLAILEVKAFGKYIGGNEYEAKISNCSGFFVERNQIATSFHILEGALSITAKHADTDAAYTIEGITAFDEKNDLVILKVSEEEILSALVTARLLKKRRAFAPSVTTVRRKTAQRLLYGVSRKRINGFGCTYLLLVQGGAVAQC